MAFTGARIALRVEEICSFINVDMKPGLPFLGMWDLPGGAGKAEKRRGNALSETLENSVFQ